MRSQIFRLKECNGKALKPKKFLIFSYFPDVAGCRVFSSELSRLICRPVGYATYRNIRIVLRYIFLAETGKTLIVCRAR